MSVLLVHKLCRRVLHDLEFREYVRADPEAALADMPFSAEERRALLDGDVAWLNREGATGFLLLILSRFEVFGLDLATFNARIRSNRDGTCDEDRIAGAADAKWSGGP